MKHLILTLAIISLIFSCQKPTIKQSQKERKQTPNADYDKAWDYRDDNKIDSAAIYFYKAKDEFILKKDSIGAAKSLINLAVIAEEFGDYYGSQELGTEVIGYLDSTKKNERDLLSRNYNSLGVVSGDLKRYDESIYFFKKAIQLSDDSFSKQLYNNNIGNNLMYLKKYEEGTDYFNLAIADTTSKNYAMVLSNLANLKFLQNKNYNPLPLFYKALKIKVKNTDLLGQNLSFAYLSDYFFANKNIDSALFYAKRMYQVAKKLNSTNDQIEALEKLISSSKDEQSKHYFDILKNFRDSVQIARDNSKNQFALIRYQTEKHKADNLVLQKKNTEKTYQLGIVATIALLSSAGGLVWYRKRQQKMKLESENLIQENKLKTSKKVHDVVANGLYRVMTEIENGDALDREDLLDKIDDMYQKSRDISYDKPVSTNAPVGFYERLVAMINSFRSADVTVTQTGHTAAFWTGVAPETKHELEHVLQELLVNMDKHSNASQVELHFLRTNTDATIRYQDNGIGLPKDVHFNNGLSSTENRIQNISGTITFEKNAPSGLEILISFPCSN